MAMELEVQNFRGLRDVRWSPRGVCALTGANGAGKTSVFAALAFLRDAYLYGLGRAVDLHGGLRGFRRFDASPAERTVFRLGVDDLIWELEPVLHGSGIGGPAGEHLRLSGGTHETFFIRDPNEAQVRFPRGKRLDWHETPFLPEFYRQYVRETQGAQSGKNGWREDNHPARFLPRFDSFLRGFRFYENYGLTELRRHGSQASSDETLSEDGLNAFALLRNWRDKRTTKERFDFVMEGLRAAFPDMFDDLEFEVAGSTVTSQIYRPGSKHGIPIEIVANGFLVALLHLCAVASMPAGSVIAIDEPENALDPYAIDKLIESIRFRAESCDLTVLLATHSPAFLNRFNGSPEQVFVMEPERHLPLACKTQPQPRGGARSGEKPLCRGGGSSEVGRETFMSRGWVE